jgi:hypothetical protein
MVMLSSWMMGASARGPAAQVEPAGAVLKNCMMLLSMPRFFDQVQERRERHPCSCFLNEVFGL